MTLLQLALLVATLLCGLVAGFLFAFAAVVMPGMRRLEDGEFLRAFQAMDRVIQNNQPLFVLVWVGSVVALLAAAALGVTRLEGSGPLLLVAAALVYLLGVQLPTVTVNIPMNNTVQALDVDAMEGTARTAARGRFEARWNRWNQLRTALAVLVSALLLVVLSRL